MELILDILGEGPRLIELNNIDSVNGMTFSYNIGLPYPPFIIHMTDGSQFYIV